MDRDADLATLLRPVVRRYRLVLGAALVAALVAGAVSLVLPPTYRATAVVVVTRPQFQAQFDPRLQTLPPGEAQPYKAFGALARAPELVQQVLEANRAALNGADLAVEDLLERLDVSQRDDPSVVQLSVEDDDPARAAQLANSWAELYVQFVNQVYRPYVEMERRLETQLQSADQELKVAEETLVAFQRENDLAVLEQRLQARLGALGDLLAAHEGGKAAVVAARLNADDQELRALLAARNGVRLALQDARSLADQVRRQGADAPGVRNGLALLVLELESLSSPRPGIQPRQPASGLPPQVSLGRDSSGEAAGSPSGQPQQPRVEVQTPVQVQVPSAETQLPPRIQLQVAVDPGRFEGLTAEQLLAELEALVATLEEKDHVLSERVEAVSRRLLDAQGLEDVLAEQPRDGALGDEVQRLTQEVYALQAEIAEKRQAQERLTLARDVAKNAYLALSNKLAEVRATGQLGEGEVRLASPAVVPAEPVAPKKAQNTLLGAVAGLLVGALGAFGLEHLPGSFRREHLEAAELQERRPVPADQ